MAKGLILGSFLLLLAVVVNGQHLLGLKGGFGLSDVSIINNDDYRTKTPKVKNVFHGGISYRIYNKSPNTGIQIELLYSQKGWNETADTLNLKTQESYSINYIELPVLSHFHITKRRFRFFFNLGPYISLATKASRSTIDLSTNITTDENLNLSSDEFNQFDWGVQVGGGLEYFVKRYHVFAEARYGYGLGDFFRDKEFASETSQSRMIYVSFGVNYFLGEIKPTIISK